MGSRPIGVFDSGVGGLTVARSIIDQLPNESILYVGDTAHGPYGPLPIAEVRANALGVMDELVDSGVKLLTIACNSASAAVLRDARERYTARYGIPVIEVIQPAVRRAVAATRSGRVGVIGTSATVGSRAYEDTFAAAPDLAITSVACPAFVPYVEAGITTGPELLAVAREYLEPLKAAGVDTVVLGCTHYPLLTGVISFVMGEDVTLVSSAEETAKDVYRALASPRPGTDGRRGAASTASSPPGTPASSRRWPAASWARRSSASRHVDHVAAQYPTGSLARITPEMIAAAQAGAGRPRISNFVAPAARTRAASLREDRPVKLTIVGCTGSFPGPRLAGVVLPADRERRRTGLEDRPGPGQRRARRHPAVHGPGGHRRDLPHPSAPGPLHGPVRTPRRGALEAGRLGPGPDPGLGSRGDGRPDGHRLRPGPGPGHARGIRFQQLDRAEARHRGPVHGHALRGEPPGGGGLRAARGGHRTAATAARPSPAC